MTAKIKLTDNNVQSQKLHSLSRKQSGQLQQLLKVIQQGRKQKLVTR